MFAAVEPLAVNLIEFPRELVAARKLRPRLAEGPLRETSQEERDQLKIFEVAPESISQTVSVGKAPADWSPIRLDNDPMDSPRRESPTTQIPLKTAPLEDRIMAGIFDLALDRRRLLCLRPGLCCLYGASAYGQTGDAGRRC